MIMFRIFGSYIFNGLWFSRVKGKRTPKKDLKHGQKGVSRSRDKGISRALNLEDTTGSKVDEMNSGKMLHQHSRIHFSTIMFKGPREIVCYA